MTGSNVAMRRRPILKAIAGSLCAPFVVSARAAETLVVTAYGGEYQDVFTKTVIEPFEKKFSCQVVYDDSGGVDPYPRSKAIKGIAAAVSKAHDLLKAMQTPPAK